MNRKLATILLTLTPFSPLLAGEAHEHGVVNLDAALDGKLLEGSIKTPAYNIVGFEHAPENAEQKRAISEAIAQLNKGYDTILIPESALYLLKDSDVAQNAGEH